MKHITIDELREMMKSGIYTEYVLFKDVRYDLLENKKDYYNDITDKFLTNEYYKDFYLINDNDTILIPEIKILTTKEKAYLKNIIKPFRDNVTSIKKYEWIDYEYITIYYTNEFSDDSINLPGFKTGTMYKGMELNKEYTIEELGL